MEINVRGDYIREIKVPLSCSHPLFNLINFTTNWVLLFEIFKIIKTGKGLRLVILYNKLNYDL